jgi:PDZ domain-containing protein
MTAVPPEPPVTRRRRRGLRIALGVVVVLLLAALVASRINLGYYVLSPGNATSVAPLITVPPDRAHKVHGAILLTDVLLGPVTALSYLPDLWSSNNQLVPTNELVPTGIPSSQLVAQGYLQMAQAKDAAKAAALRRLGYNVAERNGGVVVEGVASGTPAFGVLGVGQVVTGVDGSGTPDQCSFVARLSAIPPGDSAQLEVRQDHFTSSGVLVTGRTATKTVRLAKRPAGTPGGGACPGYHPGGGYLGVVVATEEAFTFPFPIAINTANIGGPSAGLAMTLGLINTLSGGGLTDGKRIAATGTIDPAGDVGDVGGVAQKTVAVEQSGASVFFVPVQERAAAMSKATGGLHVYAVSSLAQVLSILAHMGGQVPAEPQLP